MGLVLDLSEEAESKEIDNSCLNPWMRARDFMRNHEPPPIHRQYHDGTKGTEAGKISFEHNIEQITEEMWCKLLSFWREIQNGDEGEIVLVNTGADYGEGTEGWFEQNESGAFHEMVILKGFLRYSIWSILIQLTSFEFDEDHSSLLSLDEDAPNSDGSTYHHPRSALWNRERAKREIEHNEDNGSFRNVVIFQWQFAFNDEDQCNQVLTELDKILS